jgi:hypothetical protein
LHVNWVQKLFTSQAKLKNNEEKKNLYVPVNQNVLKQAVLWTFSNLRSESIIDKINVS